MLQAICQFYLSKVVSLGILDVLSGFGEGFTVKWPNDIYFEDKKVAGVLITNSLEGSFIRDSVVGIGMNVNQVNFSEDLPNPVSLKMISNKFFDRKLLLNKLLNCIDARYIQLISGKFNDIDNDYLACLFRFSEMSIFRVGEKIFSAKIADVLPSGELIIIHKNRKLTFAFKEIEFVI